MKTDGGWVSISDCARLYGRHRKWVYDQIKRYEIETRKENNRTCLRLVDLIAHRGEPPTSAPSNNGNHAEESQEITPLSTGESGLLVQENEFLRGRVAELEADRTERRDRELRWAEERERLERIIERQTIALPPPQEKQGAFARLLWWVRS